MSAADGCVKFSCSVFLRWSFFHRIFQILRCRRPIGSVLLIEVSNNFVFWFYNKEQTCKLNFIVSSETCLDLEKRDGFARGLAHVRCTKRKFNLVHDCFKLIS